VHTRAIRRDLATEPAVSEAVYDDERLAAVARAMALDTAPSDSFDRLASLAAMLLQAPMAIVTLVDDKRAFWHSCVASLACTPAGERETPVQESFCQHVISTGQALVVDDTAEDPRTRGLASVLDATVGAWAGFPVHSPDGQVLGSFCVADHEPRIWTARDVEVLSTLSLAASRDIALREAVEQARLEARRSAALARTLQESLLAPVLPRVPGLELASRYRPAGTGGEVVGDFFDVFQGLDGTWHAVIGDVCGKGVEAAKMTALARYTLRASAMRGGPPSAMLSELNDALTVPSTRYGVYLTALVMTVRVADDGVEATLALAGHPRCCGARAGPSRRSDNPAHCWASSTRCTSTTCSCGCIRAICCCCTPTG